MSGWWWLEKSLDEAMVILWERESNVGLLNGDDIVDVVLVIGLSRFGDIVHPFAVDDELVSVGARWEWDGDCPRVGLWVEVEWLGPVREGARDFGAGLRGCDSP
uniref:Uncharacterized protein n=1 Tax=Compsopogon caeruleus TaxID=31354 RepID=A0A6T6C8R8_9RHOD|mmetsp:Transcript_2868/g.5366  ORF Transcript_2868/g.5366 Transcript_2868/m.5366 type:complete len:104 (+) Transcript_2868:220-531(+)